MQSEDLARAAARLGGDAAWPAVDGEPVFDEPWQGRAFAMAFDVLDRTGMPWDVFRHHLVAAIADAPDRPYYESWLIALERLALEAGMVDEGAIDRARSSLTEPDAYN
jgi:nitrile hydratase accessory protein